MNRTLAAVAAVAVVVAAIASRELYFNQQSVGGLPSTPSQAPSPTAEPSPTATAVARPDDGVALGWSSDGTRLLIQKGDGNLFVVLADGSETQVTEQLSELIDISGSGRPTGATISPDGSRVVFAGLTKKGIWCHNGALFAVDADGGPAEVLWESRWNPARGPEGGIVREPTFSPDGTQIVFADGNCDSRHSVWLMNPDGSDAHQIVSSESGTLGAGHVHGLAWSPAGDRIALLIEGRTYTFAPDGSGFTEGTNTREYCWPWLRC